MAVPFDLRPGLALGRGASRAGPAGARGVVALGCAIAIGCVASDGAVAGPAAPSSAASSAASSAPSAASRAASSTTSEAPARRPARSRPRRARRDPSAAAHITNPGEAVDTPAVRYGQLSQDDCEAELTTRGIEFSRVDDAPGVLAPVRVAGSLRGVVYRTNEKAEARATSRYEVADCRLVLALDDFAQILARHDIVEVRHYSMYRPPRGWPEGKIGSRHDGAMAIDAGRFIDRAGTVLDVDRDFHGKIGAKTCGEGAAPRPVTDAALALRAILCEAVDAHLFNVVLTPNYNRPHKNHFHLEVTAGVRWFLVH